MTRFVVGLDLGSRQDYSAMVVEEHTVRNPSSRRPQHLHDVRHLERFPLGTGYAQVVESVVALVRGKDLSSRSVVLAVDATGVGRPVVEALAGHLPPRRGFKLLPITITGGDQPNGHYEGEYRWWTVPKRDLVSVVALALEQPREDDDTARRLRIAPTLPEAKTLVAELRTFRHTTSAHDTFGAWRERDHDDLVLAVACAVWAAEHDWHRPARMMISRPKGHMTEIDASGLLGGFGPSARGL